MKKRYAEEQIVKILKEVEATGKLGEWIWIVRSIHFLQVVESW